MLEYDLVGVPTQPTIPKYFQKDLKRFILAELKYQDLELEHFNQMIKKAINIEAKIALQPHFSIPKIDQHYFYSK